jgi:hypothetical protein
MHAHDQKELVLLFVLVPNELAPKLHEFHQLAVQLPDDLGTPVVGEESELLGEIDFVLVHTTLHVRIRNSKVTHGFTELLCQLRVGASGPMNKYDAAASMCGRHSGFAQPQFSAIGNLIW